MINTSDRPSFSLEQFYWNSNKNRSTNTFYTVHTTIGRNNEGILDFQLQMGFEKVQTILYHFSGHAWRGFVLFLRLSLLPLGGRRSEHIKQSHSTSTHTHTHFN